MNWLRPPADPSGALLWRTRVRLATVTMVMVTALVVIVGVTTAAVATTLMHRSIDRALDAAASDPLTLHELLEGDGEGSEYMGPLVKADTFALLVDAEGNIYGSTTNSDLVDLPDLDAVAAAGSGVDRRTARYGKMDLRLRTTSFREFDVESDDEDERDARTTLYLQTGHDMSLQRELERQLLMAIALVGILGLAGAVVVTSIVTHRALVPIREAFDTERRFVATASHELRTPIAIIRASAEILEREDLVEPAGRPLLDDIVGETDRTGRLVGDLMALAAAETGAIALERRPIHLETYFEDIARRCTSISKTRRIGLRMATSGLAPTDRVDVDPDRLDQLLLILVENALNHSPVDSEIELGLTIDRGASAATITVSDEGSGIDHADQERIFEPFERSTGARRSDGGTGLGLAIARQLASQHGARLDVHSEPDTGATFQLRLPLLKE